MNKKLIVNKFRSRNVKNQINCSHVGFEVLTVMMLKVSQCFRLFKVEEQAKHDNSKASCLLPTGILFDLFFNSEDGGDMFFWNVGRLSIERYVPKARNFHYSFETYTGTGSCP
jgi:hypothetical protein